MTTEARDALATALARLLHDAMCRVSHHDGDGTQGPCFASFPHIAAYVAPRLPDALPDGWTLARREDAEDGAALRELREALPIEHFGELFIAPKGYQMRVIRIPWGSPKEEEVHCFGGIPTIAAAARKATEALR